MKKLYISTEAKNLTPSEAIKKLNYNNIYNIELSGGKYEKDIGKKILKIDTKTLLEHIIIFCIQKNFVINLASENKIIVKKSIELIETFISKKNKIEIC